jgi:hypothetical protein
MTFIKTYLVDVYVLSAVVLPSINVDLKLPKPKSIPELDKTKAVEILLTLFERGTSGKQTITLPITVLSAFVGGSNSTVNLRLNELISAGLVQQELEGGFHGCRFISLTRKGVEVANSLNRIHFIMNGGRDRDYRPPRHVRHILYPVKDIDDVR